MARRLIPSLNRVLVEKLVQPKKSAGGILLPETSKQVSPTLFFPPSISRGATAASPCCFELAASVMGSGEGRGGECLDLVPCARAWGLSWERGVLA